MLVSRVSNSNFPNYERISWLNSSIEQETKYFLTFLCFYYFAVFNCIIAFFKFHAHVIMLSTLLLRYHNTKQETAPSTHQIPNRHLHKPSPAVLVAFRRLHTARPPVVSGVATQMSLGANPAAFSRRSPAFRRFRTQFRNDLRSRDFVRDGTGLRRIAHMFLTYLNDRRQTFSRNRYLRQLITPRVVWTLPYVTHIYMIANWCNIMRQTVTHLSVDK